ncbi:unnamed protein product [Cuscuta campestris]|uniref:Uncharacterized protein n=1 Tax=Cuscuta campestris TaxID=132261 RepID=A0A484L2Y4_9ASTE|nr:unnamed protein product [Cuscuta campestris]
MVGVFSRFSAINKIAAHRRSTSATEEKTALPPSLPEAAAAGADVAATTCDMDEFKPVQHPNEPLDDDHPVQCPFPEPSSSVFNGKNIVTGSQDGRKWKEKEEAVVEPETSATKPKPRILPSISAPEHNVLSLLDESVPVLEH